MVKKKKSKKRTRTSNNSDFPKSVSPLITYNPFLKPLIPNRVAWSFSKWKLFDGCKRKFFWKSIMRLSPKNKPSPLVISNLVHEGLAIWYAKKKVNMKLIAKKLTEEAIKTAEENADFYDQGEYDKLMSGLATVVGMLVGYSRMFKDDKKIYRITKQDVEVWYQVNMGDFDWKGKVDLLPRNLAGKQFLMEHKAVKNFSETTLETLPLDTQVRGYIFGTSEGLQRKPKQIIYNQIRKCQKRKKSNQTAKEYCQEIADDYEARPEFYFQREKLRFNLESIAAFEYDLRKIHQQYVDYLKSCHNPLDPREWSCSTWVCKEFFRTCPFLPLCLSGLDRGTASIYTQYNPENVKMELIYQEAD